MAQPQAQQTNGAAAKAAPPPAPASDEAGEEMPDLVDMLTGEAEMPERAPEAEDDDEEESGDEASEDGSSAAAEGDEETPEAAETEDDEAETAADEESVDNKIAEDAAFSDAALKKPEGIKRAREIVLAARKGVQQRQKRLDRFDTRLHKREKGFRAWSDGQRQEIEQGQTLARHVSSLLTQARNGTAAERLAALSSLSGVPGLELLEELNMGVLSDGKKPNNPEVAQLRNELARLYAAINEKERKEQEAVEQREHKHKRTRVAAHAEEAAELGADAEKYPAVAAEIEKWGEPMREQVGDWVVRHITDHYKRTGERLDKAKALGRLNARLVKRAGAPPSEPRKGSSVRDPAKSPVAQRRSAGRGVTVTPDLADRSTGVERKLSREERIAELARDRDAMKSLGLGQFLED
jgi:hypothetical protein